MAQQETYGNWLGPPPPPAKRLVRQAGIYSVAGKMTPMGDFRPASPDSFEDDYDDVSLSESDRGCKPAAAHENLHGQKSKAGTGVYTLAGKPASPNPSQKGDLEPRGGRRQSRRMTSVAVLYVLVALSFAAWVLLFTLTMMKQVEIMAELKLLRSNYSENQANVQQGLLETQREQTRLRSGMQKYYEELQDVTAVICRAVPESKKCSVGWKIFEKSCYSFSTEMMSWSDAKETCIDQGAHLVTVNSEPEQEFLKSNINSSSTYWLGLTDQVEEGNWVWANGEQTSISYWNTWKKDKDKDQKDCGSIGPDGIWNDDRCSHFNHWICEKSWNC
ncbi:CD209 antigen-like protein A [Egretta garzetta]|uniref:CD209 antigen-like protein A n=1 Tax=Egretta garzetta TaxID=188379 RepID=UPI00163CF34E|nr:CD209 antigen-like protein A [Egretta garzetta]